MVASAGRVVVIGMSAEKVPLRVLSFTEKEVDVLGSSCHEREDFEEAVRVVAARGAELVAHLVTTFPLQEAEKALAFSAAHPEETIKVMVRVQDPT